MKLFLLVVCAYLGWISPLAGLWLLAAWLLIGLFANAGKIAQRQLAVRLAR